MSKLCSNNIKHIDDTYWRTQMRKSSMHISFGCAYMWHLRWLHEGSKSTEQTSKHFHFSRTNIKLVCGDDYSVKPCHNEAVNNTKMSVISKILISAFPHHCINGKIILDFFCWNRWFVITHIHYLEVWLYNNKSTQSIMTLATNFARTFRGHGHSFTAKQKRTKMPWQVGTHNDSFQHCYRPLLVTRWYTGRALLWSVTEAREGCVHKWHLQMIAWTLQVIRTWLHSACKSRAQRPRLVCGNEHSVKLRRNKATTRTKMSLSYPETQLKRKCFEWKKNQDEEGTDTTSAQLATGQFSTTATGRLWV